jgi:hypothetical protein
MHLGETSVSPVIPAIWPTKYVEEIHRLSNSVDGDVHVEAPVRILN